MSTMKKVKYDPLSAGSIDGTDAIPHDRAICHAMNSCYEPPKEAKELSDYSLFVARLPHSVTEEEFCRKFAKAGELKSCKLIRDIVTGMSKGYGFIEYEHKTDAISAYHQMNSIEFEGRPALVDWKICDTLPGWIPRRLGGGWGGKKESGQLRFGCRDRAWHKPIVIPPNVRCDVSSKSSSSKSLSSKSSSSKSSSSKSSSSKRNYSGHYSSSSRRRDY